MIESNSPASAERPQKTRKLLPYFKWYPSDADVDEDFRVMNDTEVGFYLRCLNHSWLNNGIPADPSERRRVFRVSKPYHDKVWKRVGRKFQPSQSDPMRLVNPRQEREREEALQKSDSARYSVSNRGDRSVIAKPGRTRSETNQQLRSSRLTEARKLGTHTKQEWDSLVQFCGGVCVKCGDASAPVEKDHIIPIYQGGSDHITNLQPLCGSCNSDKGSDCTDHRLRFRNERSEHFYVRKENVPPRAYDSVSSESFSSEESGKKNIPFDTEARFSALYAKHPRKIDRYIAEQYYAGAICNADDKVKLADTIDRVHAALLQSDEWTKENRRWVPSLAKWLGNQGWTAEPESAASDEDARIEREISEHAAKIARWKREAAEADAAEREGR